MAETAKGISIKLERMRDQHVKDDKLNKKISYILRKVQAFAEIGQEGIESNWSSKAPIIPLCRAIKNNLAELEDLVLDYQAKVDSPNLLEEIRKLRMV